MLRESIDVIFKKLSLVYGRDFMARYEGLDLNEVKSDWAFELRGYEKSPHAIAYALRNLPAERPPTVFQFRAIAQRAPEPPRPRLEAPQANPEVAHKAIAEARALLTRLKS